MIIPNGLTISIQELLPDNIPTKYLGQSDVWGKNFDLLEGTNYLIEASSGKGKSSFLSFLYGLRTDYSGKILLNSIDAKSISNQRWSELRRNELGIVFQDLRLIAPVTAKVNILLKAEIADGNPTNFIDEAAEFLGITKLLNRNVFELSYGEKQRVAILRALTGKFKWLFLDEPFSHLDATNGKLAFQLIQETCKRKNANFILTTLGNESFLTTDKILYL